MKIKEKRPKCLTFGAQYCVIIPVIYIEELLFCSCIVYVEESHTFHSQGKPN